MNLAEKKCEPCKGGVPPLSTEVQLKLLRDIPGWEIIQSHHLSRKLEFPDFAQGLRVVNAIGGLAEENGHHPDLYLAWGKVQIEIWTHKIDGLTEADFVLAAKINRLLS